MMLVGIYFLSTTYDLTYIAQLTAFQISVSCRPGNLHKGSTRQADEKVVVAIFTR